MSRRSTSLGLDVLEIRELIFVGQLRLPTLPTGAVEADVPAYEDQPGRWITRRAVLRPVLQCAQTCVLKSLFRGVEVAEVAQQRRDRLRASRRDRGVYPGNVGHFITPGG